MPLGCVPVADVKGAKRIDIILGISAELNTLLGILCKI
jgi:hypothetical protein